MMVCCSTNRLLAFIKWFIMVQLLINQTSLAKRCQEGTFGWQCKFQCFCRNNTPCDPITGHCHKGCDDGRYGVGCLLKSNCYYDDQGVNYMGDLQTPNGRTKCIKWNNTKLLNSKKYLPEHFPDKKYPKNFCRNPDRGNGFAEKPWCFTRRGKAMLCDLDHCVCIAGRFGDSCSKECHCRDQNEICDSVLGTCRFGCAKGWTGPDCQTPCRSTRHGKECQETCGHCAVGTCDHENGACEYGCAKGWKGSKCKQKCSPGTYGKKCSKNCGKCLLNGVCNRSTGKCPAGKCLQGWRGRACNKRCEKSRWGVDCKEVCGECKNSKTCDPYDGLCHNGCNPGWTGQRCNIECEPGKFGPDCSRECGFCKHRAPCDRYTGQCPAGCGDSYEGILCLSVRSRSTKVAIASAVAGVVVIIIIVVAVVVIILRRNKISKRRYSLTVNMDNSFVDTFNKSATHLLKKDKSDFVDQPENLDNVANERNEGPIYENVDLKNPSQPINIEELYEYISTQKENDCLGFKREYKKLPYGPLAVHSVANREANFAKNRYRNIVAYDHSRVVLQIVGSDSDSDYVNASYIDAYEQSEAYIASQGPNKEMLNDFWRLVWEKNVYKIVMLTNLVEACKKKCEQYWPEKDAVLVYDKIKVHSKEEKVYTDYTMRMFSLIHTTEQCCRVIYQYHFTAWSDHGAPTQPTSVLSFIRKVNLFTPPSPSPGPVLTHCSAGIGRTGTFIAINNLICQAQEEGLVDVLACVGLMRANRVNMIQSVEQYIFVYDAVYEYLEAGNTCISCDNLWSKYRELTDLHPGRNISLLEKQYEILQKLSPTIDRYKYKTAITEVNSGKNRLKNILPANHCRPYLYTVVEGYNDYINAVFVHGYRQKNQFLVTQMPLPNTIADFWRMLFDYSSSLVVMLNEFNRDDETCALYWPEEYGYPVTYGPLSMELLMSTEADTDLVVREFKLSHCNKPDEQRAVKQITFKSWPQRSSVPHTTALIRLLDAIDSWKGDEAHAGPITVHCMNGASQSGLFCAASFIYESIQQDSEVDVFYAVKQIRASRPQFIESLDQYTFLYEFAVEMSRTF